MTLAAKFICNLLIFNACWFGTVYGVLSGRPWIGPLGVSLGLIVHLLFITNSFWELLFIAVGGGFGYALDTVFYQAGVLEFSSSLWWGLAPIWLLFTWFIFLSLFHVSLRWLRAYPSLAALFGFIGGPLSYRLAEGFGVLNIGLPLFSGTGLLGITWGVITPLLVWLSSIPVFDVPLKTRTESV